MTDEGNDREQISGNQMSISLEKIGACACQKPNPLTVADSHRHWVSSKREIFYRLIEISEVNQTFVFSSRSFHSPSFLIPIWKSPIWADPLLKFSHPKHRSSDDIWTMSSVWFDRISYSNGIKFVSLSLSPIHVEWISFRFFPTVDTLFLSSKLVWLCVKIHSSLREN